VIRNLSLAFIGATLCTAAALAQMTIERTNQDAESSTTVATSPAAWVYVSSTLPGGSLNEIEAFDAAPNGKLTVIPGSPFQENVTSMAVNGKYLFAVNSNGFDMESYLLESNGALHYAATTNASQPGDCNSLGSLVLDHTGATVYDMEFRGSGCANNTFESFAVNRPTGGLKDLGNSSANNWLYLPVSFVGNNVYAYTASCLGDMYWGIYGFQRSSNGLLTEINSSGAPPTPPTGYFYCPSQAAADPTDHVAITMQPVNQQNFSPDKPPQLATYTADANGNLSTTSTAANMPTTAVVNVTDIAMSPSGKLLAVGGTGGLQIFHFNGASPITHYTGLLTTDEVDQFFWDNENHLYAISTAANKLRVFTVTPTGYSEAPGSPYTVNAPHDIIVQPLPRY
jgi:6-phosphogluconolactonase (cycloisomerase 2 family)